MSFSRSIASATARQLFYGAKVLALFASVVLLPGCSILSDAKTEDEVPTAELRLAAPVKFPGANPTNGQPGECDCNNPAHWDGHSFYVFNSAGHPWRAAGSDLFHLGTTGLRCEYNTKIAGGRWIECTWKAKEGTLYGWYHLEPAGICPGAHPESPKMNLTAPKIGAVKSYDNGQTWQDLGVVLEAPRDTLKCDTKNYYFAGGNGDFSVMLDAKEQFLYFFFSNYPSTRGEQGVATARMLWENRNQPVGKVWKWHEGRWQEAGLGGHTSPFLSAMIDWHQDDADAFWGPSIHWNTYLRRYVLLMNRAKDGHFAQEGIYIMFNADLAEPKRWSTPQKLSLPEDKLAWYPQVIGINKSRKETDKLADRVARFFMRGESTWEIVFRRPGEKGPIAAIPAAD